MPYNPFDNSTITGDWVDHASYSLGGEDYPLNYNTELPAPASGTWRTTGGTGELKAGWVGSAGRRGILELDKPLGDMFAIVFQHLATFGNEGWKAERQTLALSGASANGKDYGGDTHLHIHGLNNKGQRVPYTQYIRETSTAIRRANMEPRLINDGKAYYLLVPGRKGIWIPSEEALTDVREVLAGGGLGNKRSVERVEAIWVQIPV